MSFNQEDACDPVQKQPESHSFLPTEAEARVSWTDQKTMASDKQRDYKSTPIQYQPNHRIETMVGSYPPVPPGLLPLVEVCEVILVKKVFQTSDGNELFHACHDSECCSSSVYISLNNPQAQTVAFLRLLTGGGCCEESHSEMHVEAPRGFPAGSVEYYRSGTNLTFSIKDIHHEPTFTAELTSSSLHDQTIQILSVKGAHPVIQISKLKHEKSKPTRFQFPQDMDTKMKVVILGFYLFMSYCLRTTSQSQNSSSSCDYNTGFSAGDWGSSWGDCGGGDFGGGGGDFGGGGDCGGGGDFGGGGGDCSGGGDCGGGGGD